VTPLTANYNFTKVEDEKQDLIKIKKLCPMTFQMTNLFYQLYNLKTFLCFFMLWRSYVKYFKI